MNDAPQTQQRSRLGALRVALIVLVALLAAAVAWALIAGGEDEESGATAGDPAEARILSAAELQEIAAAGDAPIYWAGERPGAELEYDEGTGERVYVRYLTGGAEAGSPLPGYLTIATYPLADPAGALQANARRTNTRVQRAEGGALVWANPDRPQSVYLAEPGADHQVEVYDPDPARARAIALSGEVVPASSGS
jgi:hypothetical protein